ncbi:putative immunity protein [Paenibacillus sp. NPDC058910]
MKLTQHRLAGQALAVTHVTAHELGAATYGISTLR